MRTHRRPKRTPEHDALVVKVRLGMDKLADLLIADVDNGRTPAELCSELLTADDIESIVRARRRELWLRRLPFAAGG